MLLEGVLLYLAPRIRQVLVEHLGHLPHAKTKVTWFRPLRVKAWVTLTRRFARHLTQYADATAGIACEPMWAGTPLRRLDDRRLDVLRLDDRL